MKIFVMDRDYETLKKYERMLNYIKPNAVLEFFTSSSLMMAAFEPGIADIFFIEIEAPNGIIAAKEIKKKDSDAKIIFASYNSDNAIEAINLRTGFIMKPLGEKDIRQQLIYLNHPILKKIIDT